MTFSKIEFRELPQDATLRCGCGEEMSQWATKEN
jgi:hypothetical protein